MRCKLPVACALAVLLAVSCKSSKKDKSKGAASEGIDALADNAAVVLDRMGALEVDRDVTCWTSFRQLDWFIAEKSYSEFATLAKITAIKGLSRALWAEASKAAKGETISAADVTGAVELPDVKVPDAVKGKLETFANDVGLQNFKDYQKTAEHWRVVLAVITDEIYHSGGSPSLKPMEGPALDAFADAVTTLSLLLLKESGSAATAARSNIVDGPHVQTAYKKIAKDLGLEAPPRPRDPLSEAEVARVLQPITRRLIDSKVKALQSFNKTSGELTEDLNKVGRLPLTQEATDLLMRDLQSFTHFVAAGFDPMRADNYLSDGSFAKTNMKRKPYLDELQVQNVVIQLFPHHIMPNGDTLVRYEPNPGPQTNLELEPFEIKLLDHEMNGVRDSAIHWLAMRNVFKEKAYAMDPFAAEYLSEVLSMMMTLWIRRSEAIAAQLGKKAIDVEVATRVRNNTYVMVPPHAPDEGKWTEADEKRKAEVMAAYPKTFYKDVTRAAGLPTKVGPFGKEGKIDGHIEPDKKVPGHVEPPVDGHVEPDKKKVTGHVEPPVDGHVEPDKKKVTGHVEPPVDGHVEPDQKKVTGHVEPPVDGHVEPDKKKVTGHVEPPVDGHVEPDQKKLTGHVQPIQGHFNLQRIMGGGIAVGDPNGDGYPDLYLTGEGLGRLYLNRGKGGAGRFTDATERMELPSIPDGHGTIFFDYDGDGDDDLVVMRSENSSTILRNDGRKFVDVSGELGFETHRGAHVVTAFDYDGDSDLDLYIGYYGNHNANVGKSKERSLPSLDGRNGSPNQLWRNEGGKFVEVGSKAGVADVGWTLAVSAFDWDSDGDEDLYLANDFGANKLFQNEGNGTFADITERARVGDRGSGMNVDVTDFNGDGVWDVYVTNIDMFSKRIKVVYPRDESTISIDESLTRAFQYLSGNKFYVSDGESGYESVETDVFEPGDRGWGWDASFFDLENDGDDDVYITNGWVEGSYAGNQKNQLFVRDGDKFYLGPEGSAEAFAGNTRSAAAVDIDLDGDIDIVANQFRQAPRVLENTLPGKNRWIRLDLVGKDKNTSAIGATVVIKAGDRTIRRRMATGRGYLSQADIAITAGVGSAETVDVVIAWPDGSTSEHQGLATRSAHTLQQSP